MNEINTLALCDIDENEQGKDNSEIYTHKWLKKLNGVFTIMESVRMGRRNIINEQINQMREMRRKGYSLNQIAKELAVSKTTVNKYCSDISSVGQPKRFRSDAFDIILSKINMLLLQLLNIGVSPDETDLISKHCRAKLDSYDTDTLFVLRDSTRGYVNFVSTVLYELGIAQKYEITFKNPTNTPQNASDSDIDIEQHEEIDDGTACNNQ